jgi:hypothetical protein
MKNDIYPSGSMVFSTVSGVASREKIQSFIGENPKISAMK